MASIPDLCNPAAGSLEGETDRQESPPVETEVDEARIARAVREILLAIGENPDREGLREYVRREIGPALVEAITGNASGLRTGIGRALAGQRA